MNLKDYLVTRQKLIDRALDRYLPKANRKPATLHRAMRYSLFAGGKRLRPILCLAAAEACRGRINDALPLACALECIHTYSLVHDDLPSMDNDDFRRGRPTCHKVFGEGIAVLAGDALLTIAFEIVSYAKPRPRYDMSTLLREIAVAAGSQKLIAGQVADLEAEGKNVKRRELQFIHENKTAAILRSSVRLGAMSANADARNLSAITCFGQRLGLAFQVIDDILDVSNIVGGKLKLVMAECDLVGFVSEAIESMRAAIDAKRIVLSADLAPKIYSGCCDHDRMRQVIWNLLSNAVKFTPDGGKVSITLTRDGRTTRMCIRTKALPATTRTRARGRCWCRWSCCRSGRSSPVSCSTVRSSRTRRSGTARSRGTST